MNDSRRITRRPRHPFSLSSHSRPHDAGASRWRERVFGSHTANVKVRLDGTVKVLDFGLAKALELQAVDPTLAPTITSPAMTGIGVLLGTASYMSPEQARGKSVDKRSDIWALGCVLFEMLTGQRAFAGEDVTETLAAVLRAEPDWNVLALAPLPIQRLLRRCLEKDLRKRVAHVSIARRHRGC